MIGFLDGWSNVDDAAIAITALAGCALTENS